MEEPLSTVPAGPPPSGWEAVPHPAGAPASSSFTVGYLVGTSFRTWGRNALFLSLLGALASLPMAVVSFRIYSVSGLLPDPVAAAQDPIGANPLLAHWRIYLAGTLVTVLVWSVAQAAAVHATAQALRGERPGIGAALAAAFHRGPYVVGVVVLGWLAMVGTACTLVGPFLLMIAWSAALPAAVLEEAGPIRALARSWGLTRGHRWRLTGGFLVLVLASTFVVLALQSVGMGIAVWAGGADALGPGRALGTAMAVYQVLAGMLGMVTIVGCSVAHHGLRIAREGGDPRTLARVFE